MPRRPIAVAITGGIGAGKSTALEAFRAHGAATVSSDEIVHHLLAADDEVRDAIVARLGEGMLGEDGSPGPWPDRRRRSSPIASSSRGSKACSTRSCRAEYLTGASSSPLSTTPPPSASPRCRCSTRWGRRSGSTRSWSSRRRRALREQRRRVAQDDRDARLLPDREKVRRADFHYVNTGTFEDLDTWVGGVMAELAAEASTPA